MNPISSEPTCGEAQNHTGLFFTNRFHLICISLCRFLQKDLPLKLLRITAVFVFVAGAAIFLYLALHHRQIYSENCSGGDHFQITRQGKIRFKALNESSGLSHWKEDWFFTHNDDTDSCLYLINAKGKLIRKWFVPYRNRDWEDVCRDDLGKIYIGDFGNNFNTSKHLRIYIVDPEKNKTEGIIRFRYLDQKGFPPVKPGSMNFDCEAMVYQKDSLYLFTKNKGERSTNVYAIPAKPGNYTAVKKQEIPLLGMVTAASLRPDGKELALLTYGKLYFFTLNTGLQSIPNPDFCFAWSKFRQSESLSYWGRDSLLAGNEQRDLYLITRK